MADVWVIAEHRDGEFRKVTFEAAGAAQKIAADLGGEVAAVVLGQGMADKAKELGKYGVAKVFHADNEAFAQYTTDAYSLALAGIIKEKAPKAVLFGASMQGKDLAGRLAAKLDAGVAVDCTAIKVEDGNLIATRPMYAGKVYADVRIASDLQIASLRPNVFEIAETGGEAVVEEFSAEVAEIKAQCTKVEKEEEGKVDLTEATIIVSGGRGMKDSDNFAILEELASLLNAAVGASRSAVDAGWRPHGDQVGQTGKVVTPNLYIACGISGAIQHLAGMGSSKVIVAINKDPDAPIHQKADFSVVGDLFDVVPALTEECKSAG
ncbi:electron transfer flavoprotein subunit alpha/FixB family protein [Dethiosulfatarculus sandiegensis]|uniref:Electron transfer flavoprotein subunit alpha n=1 Tax=Dethiosulfatarculus sandiegensis TaxID=1429043 RepID=A0A0D2JBR1_9BACT|nr:electron transfer flavoprotein subunit alpha/FixB family protein [Dethiosulfatarculus sandiegensis]KIX15579.1 electron transfer flavoprotein subunit alpha [Dethiosulfatarculus sandiegensis]